MTFFVPSHHLPQVSFKTTNLAWATRRAAFAGLETRRRLTTFTSQTNEREQIIAWNDKCVQDGRLFLAVLHATDPSRFAYDPTGNDSADLSTAFECATMCACPHD